MIDEWRVLKAKKKRTLSALLFLFLSNKIKAKNNEILIPNINIISLFFTQNLNSKKNQILP